MAESTDVAFMLLLSNVSRTACVSPHVRHVQDMAEAKEIDPAGHGRQINDVTFRYSPAEQDSHVNDVMFTNCPDNGQKLQ